MSGNIIGDLYGAFDPITGLLVAFYDKNGKEQSLAQGSGIGDLLATNNLSELTGTSSFARANLGLTIGSNVQAYHANLQGLSALTLAANKMTYSTGVGTWALTDLTAAARTLLGGADAAAMRSTLGLTSLSVASFASQAEAEAGTSTTVVMSPLRVAQAITALGGGGGAAITVQDEGTPLTTAATTLNFVGSGVVVTGSGGTKTITIAAGGDALTSGNLSQFAATTSAQMRALLTDETGTGPAVFANGCALNAPTGIVKGDVGLGNVDNTSDSTKNSATATLANKTLTAPAINGTTTGTATFPATFTMAATPSQADASTKIATTAYVDTLGATKLTGFSPVVLGAGPTAMTHSAHANRYVSSNQAGATSITFAATATSGALDGDIVSVHNVGAGLMTASGTITAPTGYKLTAAQGETLVGQYNAATDAWTSQTPSISGGGSGFTSTVHIAGLVVSKGSGNTINISAGEAYVTAATAVVTYAGGTNVSAGTLGASQWNQVYLSGAGAIEVVNNANPPSTAYLGTARQGGTSSNRRWLGAFLTDGSSNILPFTATADGGGTVEVVYASDINTGAPYRVLSAGLDGTYTAVTLVGIVPRYAAVAAKANIYLTASPAGGGSVQFSTDGTHLNGGSITVPGCGVTVTGFLSVNEWLLFERGTPQIYYLTSAATYIDVAAYKVAR